MNRPEKATRSHGKPSDDDDETTGLGLPVSLKRQIESYAVMHHMTPTQVLAEGVKLLLKQEALQQGRMNRAKPKARPCNKPFDAEERQYLVVSTPLTSAVRNGSPGTGISSAMWNTSSSWVPGRWTCSEARASVRKSSDANASNGA